MYIITSITTTTIYTIWADLDLSIKSSGADSYTLNFSRPAQVGEFSPSKHGSLNGHLEKVFKLPISLVLLRFSLFFFNVLFEIF